MVDVSVSGNLERRRLYRPVLCFQRADDHHYGDQFGGLNQEGYRYGFSRCQPNRFGQCFADDSVLVGRPVRYGDAYGQRFEQHQRELEPIAASRQRIEWCVHGSVSSTAATERNRNRNQRGGSDQDRIRRGHADSNSVDRSLPDVGIALRRTNRSIERFIERND